MYAMSFVSVGSCDAFTSLNAAKNTSSVYPQACTASTRNDSKWCRLTLDMGLKQSLEFLVRCILLQGVFLAFDRGLGREEVGLLGRELVENVLASLVRTLVIEVLQFVNDLANDCLVAALLHIIIYNNNNNNNVLYSGDSFAAL